MLGVTKKYRGLIRIGIFFFCVGFSFALFFIRVDCTHDFRKLPSPSAQDAEAAASSGVEYAVLVLTSPSNENKRNAIRSTWGNLVSNIFVENGEILYKWNHSLKEKRSTQHNLKVKVYFAIGTAGMSTDKLNQLNTEKNRKKDIIFLSNLDDKYENLSSKMKLALVWISENLKGLKYVIKCDDDSFVRVDMIVKELEAFGPQMDYPLISQYVSIKLKKGATIKGVYWGYFSGNGIVKVKRSKWQELDWFLCDYYLPYAVGGGYVISRSIVDFIAKNWEFLSCYRSEDVSMAVWTSALDGINRVHDRRFDTEWVSRGCQNDFLIRHRQSIEDMSEMYKTLVDSKGETLCNKETIKRKAYDYNWTVTPSHCCSEKP